MDSWIDTHTDRWIDVGEFKQRRPAEGMAELVGDGISTLCLGAGRQQAP